jgi:hypothetical protein
MIVCPVCEHPQDSGAECELCGKRFAPGSLPVAAVPPLEGLETTHHAPVELPWGSDSEPIPELEPTSSAPVDAPEERTPDVEPTAAAPVDVDSALIPDIERQSAEIPGDAPTALPLAPLCRYCRTPSIPGERTCSRCGMRLEVVDPELVSSSSAAGVRQCPNCGTIATRSPCPACGNRISF